MATFGDTGSASTNDNYANGQIQLRKFTSFPGGLVESMSLMLRYTGSSGCKVRGVIYNDSSGPSSCVFTTAEYTIVSGDSTLAFHTLNRYGGGTESLAAGDYWLGFWVGVSDLYTGDGTTGGTGWYAEGITYSSTNPPGSVSGGGAYNRNTRIYLTYSEAASGSDRSALVAFGIA